jgi:hypothetical protein
VWTYITRCDVTFTPVCPPISSIPKTLSRQQAFCAPNMATGYRSLVPLAKFQMAPAPSALMSSGFKKNEPRYLCLREARASHSHRTCTEVSSSVPHFLQVGSLLNPITCRCRFRVCPASRPITALDCVLLKDSTTILHSLRFFFFERNGLTVHFQQPHSQAIRKGP